MSQLDVSAQTLVDALISNKVFKSSNEIEEITTEAVAVEEVTEAREEKALNEEVAIEEAEAFAPSVVAAPENIAVVETPAGYRYYYRY